MMLRFKQQILEWTLVSGAIVLLLISTTACVSSKPKGGGRTEAKVELPAKSDRVKPELHRSYGPTRYATDSLSLHSLDWAVLDSQLQTVNSSLDRRFLVEGFGPFILA